MNVWDVVDPDDFDYSVNEGYVRIQRHPEFPSLCIANYTESAVFDGVWNSATRNCRGLIFNDDTRELVARPFPKFFNWGQVGSPVIPLDAEVWATDKIDGSLGILYRRPDGQLAVATRGSFASEQAQHATRVLHSKYADWVSLMDHFKMNTTYLFEIVYPENRIVCDYRGMDDLVLLGRIDFDGTYIHPNGVWWDGPRTRSFPYDNLSQALASAPRPGAEGLVLYFPEIHDWVKLKQEDYKALHAVVTNTTDRRLYEVVAVNRCKDYIKKPSHWGTYLYIDPEVAKGILSQEYDWKDSLIDGIPDEFYSWVTKYVEELESGAELDIEEARKLFQRLLSESSDRKHWWETLKDHPMQRELMAALTRGEFDEGQITLKAFGKRYPQG